MDVARVLEALDRVLPPGASASWLDAGTDAGADPGHAGVAAPSAPVCALLHALTRTLGAADAAFAGDGSSVLLEAPGRTVLAHRCGAAGTLVVEAGQGLNLALVRRVVRAAVDQASPGPATASGVPVPAPDPAPGPPALPRRRPPAPVTEFRYVPEDLGVLDQLQQALSS
jgi:hypothetical protein